MRIVSDSSLAEELMFSRDDFSVRTKDLLARRVGYRCSNPQCRKLTVGPHVDDFRTVNVGVAAHISAAAAGGPRFSITLSPGERRSSHNGIWLCQTCAKLIDADTVHHTQSSHRHSDVVGANPNSIGSRPQKLIHLTALNSRSL
jgi:hypothetical protein